MIRPKVVSLRVSCVVALAICALGILAPRAKAQSLPETAEAINKSRVTTRVLFITAHPDDEWSSVLAYLSRGEDADVALLTLTRGQGGQNAIGPEQDGPLGVIRTEELLAAGQHYGVRQYFTRAMDFGFSKSPDQTMKIWGDVVLEDMVRVIRTYRPDVVINGWGGVHSGHGHHQASGILTPKAVALAADPTKYPDQIAEGLPAWKTTLELRLVRNRSDEGIALPVYKVSPLWGKSYAQLGAEGHELHRSQGTPAFAGNAFYRSPVYLVAESGTADGKFDAKLLAEPLSALTTKFPASRVTLAAPLASADAQLALAQKDLLRLDRDGAAAALAEAGKTIKDLRETLSKRKSADAANAGWELTQVSNHIDRALQFDVALPIEAQADRHELVAGESLPVHVNFSGEPAVPVKWRLNDKSIVVPSGWTVEVTKEQEENHGADFEVKIPARAKSALAPSDVILPFPPPLVSLALPVQYAGYEFTIHKAVQSTEAKTTGIFTYPLELVPAVTLTVEPQQAMLPVQHDSEPTALLARIRYHGTKPVSVTAGLDAPQGWSAATIPPLDFSGPGDQLIRFVVTPPAQPATGAYKMNPYARIGSETFRDSLEPIPTLPTRDWIKPDDATVHVLDLNIPANLHVGYVATEGDLLPDILKQLGIKVDLLDEVELAFGDLSRFDAIVVGFRAYELRPDVMRSNPRLLDYVKDGGTLVVQYQRNFAGGSFTAAPYPASMPDATSRVTDAHSPVRFLAPDSALLNFPNQITAADFKGWVQERGIYFWGNFDSKYTPVLGLTDHDEPETKGSLVYAKYGKGLYIFTGLSFFRELPAGVPGAYRLFVNLLSPSKAPSQQ
ncbi:MAG: PIG-L family deacetylase [Candidatus Acidiferrales bacterium]